MRYLSIIILALVANIAQAQQVNPVTDYTFANRMSSGRSTVTDTAAYFSIGPRYGAVRGMMPPMVTDTTAMSANKRNGLLIFSIQKNKYQVWDSAGAKWADITGAAGSAIISADTADMLLPYLRKADTTAMLNPYLRGSGTANYLPIFDASRSVINSKVYQSGTNLLFNTTTASFTTSGISTIEANNTSASVFALKVLDTTRSYIASNSSNTMDINNLRAGDIRFYTNAQLRGRFQTDGTFRLNSLTGTGSRIVVADADGVLSATSSATGLVDTTVLSTRSWRQKGDDSLGAIIATKGSGTVTSVATGYGLSGGTITTTGTISADTLQLSTRAWRQKGLDSLAALEVSGTGTAGYLSKFTATSTIGNSPIFDNSGNIGIGTTNPAARLDIRGSANQNIYLISTATSDQNNSIESYRSNGGAWSSMLYRGLTHQFLSGPAGGPLIESARFTSSNEFLINTTTDAGDYKLQVSGNAYVTGTTVLAATSGNVGVGLTSPSTKLHIFGGANTALRVQTPSGIGLMQMQKDDGTANWNIEHGRVGSGFGIYQSGGTNGGNTQFYVAEGGYIGIGTTSPNASALVDITSTVRGFLPPRMTTTQRDAISSPAAGLVIYNTTTSKLQVYTTSWTDLH